MVIILPGIEQLTILVPQTSNIRHILGKKIVDHSDFGMWDILHELHINSLCPSDRAGVKYVLSNTNTNTNTFFSRVSNTNTNTPAKIWSNTNTNTNTAHQIQIQIQIHNEAETKLPPFYRWLIQIHCIVRRLFCLFKFHWKSFPKVQSTVISLHWFR